MTSRSRSVAASGAKVNPERRRPFSDQIHEIDAEAFDAQAGQSHTQFLGTVFLHGALHQFFYVGVVGTAEAQKTDLFESALLDHVVNGLKYLVRRPLTHRAEDHAGLAKTAARAYNRA